MKEKTWTFERVLNAIGILIGVALIVSIVFALSSCYLKKPKQIDDTEHIWIGGNGIKFEE